MPFNTFKSLSAMGSSGAWFRPTVLRRLAVFVAVCLPLVWLFIGLEQVRLREIAERESSRDLQNLTRAFSEEVKATISTIDLSLIQLRLDWRRNPADFEETVRELNHYLEDNALLQVAVVDTRGVVVFASGGLKRHVDLSDREHIQVQLNARDDRLFISRPVLGRLTGAWTVQLTRPLRDAQGRPAGAIMASVAPAYFSRFYSSIDLGPDASIALVRSDGTVIARTTSAGGNRDMGKVLKGHPYLPDSPLTGQFRRVGQLDGVERYYAWRSLPGYGVMVTVGQSVPDSIARYARQEQILTYTGLAASLALVLLGWAAIAASDNRRRAVEALAAAEARWTLALKASGDGVWDADLVTGQATLSPRAQVILDTEETVLTLDSAALKLRIHPGDVGQVERALTDHLAGKTADYAAEHRVLWRDGSWRWVLSRARLASRGKDGAPQRIVGTVSDIDARKKAEQQIHHMAHHDALTGLPNRVLFADRLRQAMLAAQREGGKVGVIYFDLDKFKPVNDTHGHAVGDALLQAVASRVRGALRESDTLARIGGDEFVVLLPRCSGESDALTVANNILVLLNQPFEADGKVLAISGSLGLAVHPDCGGDDHQLLRCADQAMYEAKAQGRARVCAWRAPVPA
jgi:diguanylate cyclase (GGDEF)-like protein/PAS domain S-box-containing protein